MKRVLLISLIVLLVMAPLTGCSKNENTDILRADFEIQEKEDMIMVQNKSESDFDNVQYSWTLKYQNEKGDVLYEDSFTGKEVEKRLKPNTKKATLKLNLLAEKNNKNHMSEKEKQVPTNFVEIIIDPFPTEEKLIVYFGKKANTWILEKENGETIKEKKFNQKVSHVEFKTEDITEETIIIKVFNDDWFLNQKKYNFDDEDNNESNSAPNLNPIGDKTITVNNELEFTISGDDPDGDSLTYSVDNLPNGASFDNQTFNWTPSDVGDYSVTFTVSDGELTNSEEVTVTVNEEEKKLTAEFDGEYITVYSEKTADFIHWTIDDTTLGYSTDNFEEKDYDARINIAEFDELDPGNYTVSIQAYDNDMNELYDPPTTIEITK